jgi:hypothetical protein
MDITLRVLVFKILLPHPGWHLRADGEPDERSPTVWTSRIRVADPRVAARREKQYQLRIVDRSLEIPPCHTQASPERVKQHEHTRTPMTQPDKDHDDGSDTETDRVQAMVHGGQGPPTAQLFEREPVWARDFTDLSYEWQPRD